MTMRDTINRRVKWTTLPRLPGGPLAMAGTVLHFFHPGRWGVRLIAMGLTIVVVSMVVEMFYVRCPSCRAKLGPSLMWHHGLWSIAKDVKFCPFCGVAFDVEGPQELTGSTT